MSLLVHELLIGTGSGGGSNAAALKSSSSEPVPIASVTVSHANPTTLQVADLQQSTIVTITSNQARFSEKGSQLAEALAGNPSYYTTESASTRVLRPQHVCLSLSGGNQHLEPPRLLKSSATSGRHSYVLPFVLQDHNYGAPPPPTPPHSPPAPVTALQVLPSVPVVPPPPMVSPQLVAAMPLQQFMPQPKTAILVGETGVTGSRDTDDEERVSNRSSSVGPSGEETETAPEGDGEEDDGRPKGALPSPPSSTLSAVPAATDDSVTRCVCNFTHDDGYMIQCDRCFVWQHVDCMEIDRNNIPDEYLCEACKPRFTDKSKARALQIRRRQEIRAHLARCERVSSSDSDDNGPPSKSRLASSSLANKNHERKLKKKKPKQAPKEASKTSVLRKQSTSKEPTKGDEGKTENKPASGGVKSRRQRQSSLMSPSLPASSPETQQVLSAEGLRSWLDAYEVAVTNHYSPELRAKVYAAARVNGISHEFRESAQAAVLGHRCRVVPRYDAAPESIETKVLAAAMALQPGTAIIEYQGKYALKSQWQSVPVPSGLSYVPFVLQYAMQKEGLSVCVDARTYGNDARFARRAAQYNSEIRHVVERGSVHLYIVASREIDEEEEIILPLETAVGVPPNTPPSVLAGSASPPLAEPREQPKMTLPLQQTRKNGLLGKRSGGRKSSLSLSLPAASSPPSPTPTPTPTPTLTPTATPSPSGGANDVSASKQRRASGCGPLQSPAASPKRLAVGLQSPQKGSEEEREKKDDDLKSTKMTREERKIAAYMKAFERMEKAAQRRQQGGGRRRGSSGCADGEEGRSADDEAPSGREQRRGRRCSSSSSRSAALLKAESTEESQEEDATESSAEGGANFHGADGGSPPSVALSCRFPKTKKSMMTEWLNEPMTPVAESAAGGVSPRYLRLPLTRKEGAAMVGRSAKKRWLRQAIIDETEEEPTQSQGAESPMSSGDYITPLKKRRLVRDSMSSEEPAAASSPAHTTPEMNAEEHKGMEMDLNSLTEDTQTASEEEKSPLETIAKDLKVKKESSDDEKAENVMKTEDGAKPKEEMEYQQVKKEESEQDDKMDKKREVKEEERPKELVKKRMRRRRRKDDNTDEDDDEKALDRNGNMQKRRRRRRRGVTPPPTKGPKTPEGTPPETPTKVVKKVEEVKECDETKKMTAEETTKEATPEPELKKAEKAEPTEMLVEAKPIAAIKRKLSILEYRQRKSFSCEREAQPKEGEKAEVPFLSKESTAPVPSTPPREAFLIASPSGEANKGGGEKPTTDKEEVRWDAAPTPLERQRETMRARLRRDFGLLKPLSSPATVSTPTKDTKAVSEGPISPPLPPPLPTALSVTGEPLDEQKRAKLQIAA